MKWIGLLLLVRTVFSASHNPDENVGINNPNLFEGDMILPKEQIRKAENGEDIDSSRKRGSSRFRKWPNGVVCYEIDRSLARSSRAVAAIKAGMGEWTSKTCIRFRKRSSERACILFRSGSGCASSVGRTGSRQYIYLASGCWTKGIVAHEIGHAVGFYHEQSRPDRDKYVTIIYRNIRSADAARNFRKYPRSTIDSLGTEYDYGSLMHYGRKAFSRNERDTIVPKRDVTIGQRRGLSPIDAQQANLLYKAQCERRGEGNMCSNYKVLNSADRSQGNGPQNNVRCDQRDLQTAAGWYRFMGAAGNQISDKCVPVRHCGTHATGWLSGDHPSVEEGVVTRRVCYHWSNNCCRFSNNIRVKNCGGYFVYELHWPSHCYLRYCGKKGPEPTTKPPTTTPLPATTEATTKPQTTTQLPVTSEATTKPQTTTQLPVTSESCRDRARTCSFWASFCSKWEFVKDLCNKTCRVC